MGEKVFVLAERIRKKAAPGKFYKQSVQNISYFNKDKTFIIRRIRSVGGIKLDRLEAFFCYFLSRLLWSFSKNITINKTKKKQKKKQKKQIKKISVQKISGQNYLLSKLASVNISFGQY